MDKKEKRTVYLLGTTSMLNDISSEGIYSILPYYIENTALIGVIGGLFNGLGNILKVLFGYIADRTRNKKNIIIVGYFLSAISKTLMALVSITFLPLLVILDRIGKGIRDSPRDAIISLLKERGHAFGIHRALDRTGALIGVILTYFILKMSIPYKDAIILFGIIGFLSIIPLLFIYEPKSNIIRESIVYSLTHLSSGVRNILLPVFLTSLAFVSPMVLISLAKQYIELNAILLYILYIISYVISSQIFGKISDKYGRKLIFYLASLEVFLSFVLLYLATIFDSIVTFALAFILYGAGIGAYLPNLLAYIGDKAKRKGLAIGVVQTVYGTAILISSSIFGVLLNIYGNHAIIVYSILPIIAVLVMRSS